MREVRAIAGQIHLAQNLSNALERFVIDPGEVDARRRGATPSAIDRRITRRNYWA
jgi:hypothetical protein